MLALTAVLGLILKNLLAKLGRPQSLGNMVAHLISLSHHILNLLSDRFKGKQYLELVFNSNWG
jgi:hypothetical protein